MLRAKQGRPHGREPDSLCTAMFRQFKPTLQNLNIVLEKLNKLGCKESIHFRNCLKLATTFGPRGDKYFALKSDFSRDGSGRSSDGRLDETLGNADAFLKLDCSAPAWHEVHLHNTRTDNSHKNIFESLEKVLDWASPMMFVGVPPSMSPSLRDFCRGQQGGICKTFSSYLFGAPSSEWRFNGSKFSWMDVGCLGPEWASAVDANWKYRYEGSYKMIREQLELGLGFGAFIK